MSGNIKVVVRCRPLNSREIARGATPLIRMEGNRTFLDPPPEGGVVNGKAIEKETKNFAFDHSYWSAGPKDDPQYASQHTLYNDLGVELLDHAFGGFNACIFAYGQTGSGKSYSMMGYGSDKGIIPLTCSALFDRIDEMKSKDGNVGFNVEVSFMEIYNEKVRDLLNPKNKGNLRVREHPLTGPYVEDLAKLAVESFANIEHLMDEGNKARTVAATNMNETSSRSHSVFTIIVTQKRTDSELGMSGEKVSRISLVDLAGSERANSTGATGQRLKEGANINKSLTTLGKVIQTLALHGSGVKKGGKDHIPYRDSILTWLLKDSIGGNSKTAMIAAISPADYEETLSTLRYADQAKKIKNAAVVNEDPNAKLIRELKEELDQLRGRMGSASGSKAEATYDKTVPPEKQMVVFLNKEGVEQTISKAQLQEQFEASQKLLTEVNTTWEEKIQNTAVIQQEREKALEELGITIEKNNVGVHTPKKTPHLVNLNEDPLMSECLIYQIKPGKTLVGRVESEAPIDIRLSGSNILNEHCTFECSQDMKEVSVTCIGNSTTMVNGIRLKPDQPKKLKSGYRIILGDFHVFRFNNPEQARMDRDIQKSKMNVSVSATDLRSPGLDEESSRTGSPATRPDSPISRMSEGPEVADWDFARREAITHRLPDGYNMNLEHLPDEELNRLYNKISKARHHRKGTSIGRPESRISYLTEDDDDDDSASPPSTNRPSSGSAWTTEESVDTTLTYGNTTIPEVDELEYQMRKEYEQRSNGTGGGDAEDYHIEKQQMEDKLKLVQTEMKRMLDVQKKHYESKVKKLRAGKNVEDEDFEFVTFTPQQFSLINSAVRRWRSCTRVRMAQTIMSQAVLLKEANVISRELNKRVSYQFVVVESSIPVSGLETISGLADLDEVADPVLESTPKPCVGVKVLDGRHSAIYIWSLEKLQQRIQQMRNLYNFIDKPEYSANFNWDAPFYEDVPPNYSFVGSAVMALSPLSLMFPSTSNAPISSRHTTEPIATCRIRIRPTGLVSPPHEANGANGVNGHSRSKLHEGSKLSFEISIDKVSGFSPAEFASVHCQVRLSTLAGPTLSTEEVLTSIAVDATQLNKLKHKRQITVGVTDAIAKYISDGYATVEFFAEIKPPFLNRIERWDETRDETAGGSLPPPSRLQPPTPELGGGRRSETELEHEQKHDVMASLQICELSGSGSYDPVQVIAHNTLDPGAFYLRQGLQRRLVLELKHNSGHQLEWTRICEAELSHVRLLDPRGRIHASKSSERVFLRAVGKQTPEFSADGTSKLVFAAPWDSSVHDSMFLDRTTAQNHRVLLRFSWKVEVESCEEPIAFNMDMAVTIQGRDARAPFKLMSFLSSSRLLHRATALFAVRLTPFTPKNTNELWRLNTAGKFVRGEEVLGRWRPRGLNLIRDSAERRRAERRCADVDATQSIIASYSRERLINKTNGAATDDEAKVKFALNLWMKEAGTKRDIILTQDPASTNSPTSSASSFIFKELQRRKLAADVRLVPRTDAAAKRGYLSVLRDPTSDKWHKQYFVLRRPYLHFYESSSEIEELGVINISSVRVDFNPEIERMLNRRYVFAMYTAQNCYFFQAPSARELESWMWKIDPLAGQE